MLWAVFSFLLNFFFCSISFKLVCNLTGPCKVLRGFSLLIFFFLFFPEMGGFLLVHIAGWHLPLGEQVKSLLTGHGWGVCGRSGRQLFVLWTMICTSSKLKEENFQFPHRVSLLYQGFCSCERQAMDQHAGLVTCSRFWLRIGFQIGVRILLSVMQARHR